jgi:hypothetical protein
MKIMVVISVVTVRLLTTLLDSLCTEDEIGVNEIVQLFIHLKKAWDSGDWSIA